MLIAAVRSDARRFEKLYKEHAGEHAINLDPGARPLILHLRCQLLGVAPPPEQSDLMPAGAGSLAERIHETLDNRTVEARLGRSRVLAETFEAPEADGDAKLEAAWQVGRDIWDAPGDAALAMLHPIVRAMVSVVEDCPRWQKSRARSRHPQAPPAVAAVLRR